MTTTRRTLLLTLLLASVAGAFLLQRNADERQEAATLAALPAPAQAARIKPPPGSEELNGPATGSPAASSPAVAAAEPEGPRVEQVEPADTESPLERLLPRRSAGHAAGLDKVPDPLRLESSAALVIDAATRKVMYSKNETAVLPIASITKLMTAVVIAESQLDMNQFITVTDDDVDLERHSRSRLKPGTTLSRTDALHLALMSSENRAAHALGRTHPAGLAGFVAAMNAKAASLGMNDTRYVDPTGLSNGNRSSARDLATLVLAASHLPVLREFSTTPQYRVALGKRALQYSNSNRLVKNSQWDIALQKTGYIVEAGHCVVMKTSIARRDLVMVLLDADNNTERSADAERLRKWIDPTAVVEQPKPARVKRQFNAKKKQR